MILTFFLGFSLIFISEYLKRREGDSNPRSLSAQRFSRPPQSTTLPSLLENRLPFKKLKKVLLNSSAKVYLFFELHNTMNDYL